MRRHGEVSKRKSTRANIDSCGHKPASSPSFRLISAQKCQFGGGAVVGALVWSFSLQMTWNSTMSSGYSSLEEDSEEYFFTARTSFIKKPVGKVTEGKVKPK